MKKRKLKTSTMTGKLEWIGGMSTSPLDNPFCLKMRETKGTICEDCYSCKMLEGMRKNCRPRWKEHGEILSEKMETKDFPRISEKYFRFHPHGELLNKEHFLNFCRIAGANPGTKFVLFTKRRSMVLDEFTPDNMVLMYSNPWVDKPMSEPPKGFHKVFNTTRGDEGITCGSKKCADCLQCFTREGRKVITEKVK